MSVVRDGNDIALLENGEAYFPLLEAAIDAARREVHLETYLFADDRTGWRIAEALMRAARRGVDVRVLVDGFGGRPFVERIMTVLEATGVSVRVYRREVKGQMRLQRHRLRRMHRKIALIDAHTAFVGGINIIDDYTPGAPPYPRYDYAVRIKGPLVVDIAATLRRLWWVVSWAALQHRDFSPPRAPVPHGDVCGDTRAALVIRDNLGHRHDIEDAYLHAIANAREEIVIACAYFFPGRRFRQALVDAARRGVRVILLLQGLADHPMMAYATRALYPYFLSHDIRLFEYHRSYLHAKVAVVDDSWATVGSSNIDPFSLLLAREANIVVRDAEFSQALRLSLERAMVSGALELRREDWQRLPRLRRLATWFAYQFVRFVIGLAGFRDKH